MPQSTVSVWKHQLEQQQHWQNRSRLPVKHDDTNSPLRAVDLVVRGDTTVRMSELRSVFQAGSRSRSSSGSLCLEVVVGSAEVWWYYEAEFYKPEMVCSHEIFRKKRMKEN